MGFTPLDGLVMATRAGAIDPGLVLWLAEHAHTPLAELAATLEYRSGLLGLAGQPRTCARSWPAPRAATVPPGWPWRSTCTGSGGLIASMAAALGGLDTLVFTGGVGEHAAEIRARAANGLGFLSVAVDEGRNARADGDTDITACGAAVRAFVVAAREDIEIARQVERSCDDEGPC